MRPDIVERLKEDLDIAPVCKVTRNRFGYEVDGQRLKRVTTLLGGLPKPALVPWAAKAVAEFAVDHQKLWIGLPRTDAVKLLKGSPYTKRDDAGDRGTAIHNALEAHVRREPLPDGMNADELACANGAMDFLKARGSRTLAAELTVFNLTMGYAGTLDLWEMHDGVSTILDWKSSRSIYPEHAVQQIAYKNAEFAVVQKVKTGDEAWMGKLIPWKGIVERCGIVHVEPTGATLYPIRKDYHDKLWDVFRAACFIKTWQSDVDSYGGKTPKEPVFGDHEEYRLG